MTLTIIYKLHVLYYVLTIIQNVGSIYAVFSSPVFVDLLEEGVSLWGIMQVNYIKEPS